MTTQPQFTPEQAIDLDHGTRDIPQDAARCEDIGGPVARWIAADGAEISARAQSDGMIRVGIALFEGSYSAVYGYAWTGAEAAVLVKRAIAGQGAGQIFRA